MKGSNFTCNRVYNEIGFPLGRGRVRRLRSRTGLPFSGSGSYISISHDIHTGISTVSHPDSSRLHFHSRLCVSRSVRARSRPSPRTRGPDLTLCLPAEKPVVRMEFPRAGRRRSPSMTPSPWHCKRYGHYAGFYSELSVT